MSASPIRLGAVSYLNTAPLVFGLEQRTDLFTLRYDVPSQCAELLHDNQVDLGLIPAIEYLCGEYRIVPGVAIGSDGPIASVALFSRTPIAKVTRLALDLSSRTSVALTRILCARHWRIDPTMVAAEPDLRAMLADADAALIIGDPALAIDPLAERVVKTDLGSEWRAMTGLPFVYAMWSGRPGVATAAHIEALNSARDRGVAAIEDIARSYAAGHDVAEQKGLRYLRDNLKYGLADREMAGLRQFYDLAAELGLVEATREIRFY
jgi:chorismate dehydratase